MITNVPIIEFSFNVNEEIEILLENALNDIIESGSLCPHCDFMHYQEQVRIKFADTTQDVI